MRRDCLWRIEQSFKDRLARIAYSTVPIMFPTGFRLVLQRQIVILPRRVYHRLAH
jgi:hypothetical protein